MRADPLNLVREVRPFETSQPIVDREDGGIDRHIRRADDQQPRFGETGEEIGGQRADRKALTRARWTDQQRAPIGAVLNRDDLPSPQVSDSDPAVRSNPSGSVLYLPNWR